MVTIDHAIRADPALSQRLHKCCSASDGRAQVLRSRDERKLGMSVIVEVSYGLKDALRIVHAQIADQPLHCSYVEEDHRYVIGSEFLRQGRTEFRGHHSDAANFVFDHTADGKGGPRRIIVRIAQQKIKALLQRASFEALNDVGKKG